MKQLLLLISIGFGLSAFTFGDEPSYRVLEYDNFGRGERLEFSVNFGIFTIGEAEMIIDDKFYKVNHRECYKIDIFGRTSGMVDWVANVNDHWGAYVDSAALVPHISYRNIREGKYKKDEVVRFDHRVNLIETKVADKKTGKFKEPKVYVSQGEVRDMMAGALYLRTIDFSKMKKGDKFIINGFFEDTFYDLEMIYRGREKVKTKAGKFNAIRLAPVVPDNELFDGEDSVIAWVTDDENRMPLKIQAKMFIGNVSVELTDYKNTQHDVTSKIK
ncbi:DUF3108 domain-containing protein [Fulvivirga sp.]|jgi:hypothetical protein|uniref:DUF3108 domain-containing protein n=2 Tax=Fulvivirga sp. TaxID=1931237 RepID=UPI0032EAB4F8